MNIESYREYCLSLPLTGEKTPFDQVTLVFTVVDKMFALANMDKFESINLKCDPEKAIQFREEYPAIIPGWHMNKKHWNTLILDGSLNDDFIYELTKHSYDCVVNSLPKKVKMKSKILQTDNE
jgi:predicted DNA-binding protein (MmcQ/YjbR family)